MRLAPTELTFVSKVRSVLLGDVLASRVLVSAFGTIASLSSERDAVNKSSALTTNRFPCGSAPKLLLKERQVLSSRISIARWKQWGKLSRLVVRAVAANSNKGSPIGTWPRITSGFTSNCSAVHLLKQPPRVASCDRAEARLLERSLAGQVDLTKGSKQ
jgi:hypothetical protein